MKQNNSKNNNINKEAETLDDHVKAIRDDNAIHSETSSSIGEEPAECCQSNIHYH